MLKQYFIIAALIDMKCSTKSSNFMHEKNNLRKVIDVIFELLKYVLKIGNKRINLTLRV